MWAFRNGWAGESLSRLLFIRLIAVRTLQIALFKQALKISMGTSIAVASHSLVHSLFSRLIPYPVHVGNKEWWAREADGTSIGVAVRIAPISAEFSIA